MCPIRPKGDRNVCFYEKKLFMMSNNNINLTKILVFYLPSEKIKSLGVPHILKKLLSTMWKSKTFRITILNFLFFFMTHRLLDNSCFSTDIHLVMFYMRRKSITCLKN